MKKLLASLAIALVITGCSQKPKDTSYPNTTFKDYSGVKGNCPKVFIGSELDSPNTDDYNLVYLVSASTLSFEKRLDLLKKNILTVESIAPNMLDLNTNIRDDIFESQRHSQKTKEILADLFISTYMKKLEADKISKFTSCDYSTHINTAIYLKTIFTENQTLLTDALTTSKDVIISDID